MKAQTLILLFILAVIGILAVCIGLSILNILEDVAEVVEVVSAPILEPEGILVSIVKALFGLFGGFL